MQAFWGLVQMTMSFELKRLKTLRVFNLLAPFATNQNHIVNLISGEKGLFAIMWQNNCDFMWQYNYNEK